MLSALISDRSKHLEALLFSTNDCGRIIKGPVQASFRSRKDRTGFVSRSQTVMTSSKGCPRYPSNVFDSCTEMSISFITLIACGLTTVYSVPALQTSKRSFAR